MERFLQDRVTLHCGDCRNVLASLDENSIDSCVTDPPYHLVSIVKRFATATLEQEVFAQNNPARQYGALSRGFMGKVWDGGDIAFQPETWAAVYRVLKPGAHMLAMGGTRTFDMLGAAIRAAGFEVRDTMAWIYSQGFPKSHDVSKGIDRAAGAGREVVGLNGYAAKRTGHGKDGVLDTRGPGLGGIESAQISIPATDAAREWEGWGTALKPAMELIVLARKPLSERTVAANVLKWNVGAINVDGCRVVLSVNEDAEKLKVRSGGSGEKFGRGIYQDGMSNDGQGWNNSKGRWPANVIHDGSEEVVAGFPETGISAGGRVGNAGGGDVQNIPVGQFSKGDPGFGDSGSAARYFYTAKADADDRLGSRHPTIKPLDLMQYLVRLITPPGGVCLDPFAGTGTTGEAAFREGCNAVLIEAEPEYQADIRRRMALVLAGPDERVRESIKAKNLPLDPGPLFAWKETP